MILGDRLMRSLRERQDQGMVRRLPPISGKALTLNLADNDYLELAKHPEVVAAARAALEEFGCSASASPLITGYAAPHRRLEQAICDWFETPSCLIWTSGFAANQAVLGHLPGKGDLILADRYIHHSMIQGILRSGARLRRYGHCDLDQLERWLQESSRAPPSGQVFVVTESVFSMDGDYPDIARLASLKKHFGFCWILDEAHALGWYGSRGEGLAGLNGVFSLVDVFVGTLGKALGSLGGFTLFADACMKDYLINFAGEFIYSTYLPPACAAAAERAIRLVRAMDARRAPLRLGSESLRQNLNDLGLSVASGDSPVVPVVFGDTRKTCAMGDHLERQGIKVGVVRPPTVPHNTSRLRISLKPSVFQGGGERLYQALADSMRKVGY